MPGRGKINSMNRTWPATWAAIGGGIVIALCGGVLISGEKAEPWHGVLDEHPAIQYANRPTADRVAALKNKLANNAQPLQRDPATGYLRGVLSALGVPEASQLLVFSKTGVQRAFTSPHNPRAIFFDESVAVGYVPGAPLIEIAAHDPQQGVVFYTLDQTAARPAFTRATSCLTCHVSATTLGVPGMIARSNTIGEDGNVLAQTGSHNVNHQTPHPDRWGGWFVTSEDAAPPYQQLAHRGNITFSGHGNTSNQVFVDWLGSSPETRGYVSPSSDIVGLLLFDHQTHAINLLTRLNWEARIASSDGRSAETDASVRSRVTELADYLLFAGEAPPLSPLTPVREFAVRLESRFPKDHRGRSFAQLDMVDRLLRYPCSYMIYSDAFEALPSAVKQSVYRRMIDVLSANDPRQDGIRDTAADRRAILEILADTKTDFPH
jgi:hypothetical protein